MSKANQIKRLRKKNYKLRNEIADAKAFAYNMLPNRTEFDTKETLDEQLGLLYDYIRKMQCEFGKLVLENSHKEIKNC
jgi:hypothetical protein